MLSIQKYIVYKYMHKTDVNELNEYEYFSYKLMF